nr:Zinc knuckle family protein [Ipomoea batatas]
MKLAAAARTFLAHSSPMTWLKRAPPGVLAAVLLTVYSTARQPWMAAPNISIHRESVTRSIVVLAVSFMGFNFQEKKMDDGEDSCVFTIKLHIGGNLVWKPKVEYKDGFVEYFDHFNCDEGSLLDLRRMVKQLRFADKKVQFWVKVKGRRNTKKIELRKVSTDTDILVLNLEVPSNKELDIYVEHLYDDQWDYEVEISRSLGDDALMTDEGDEGSEQNSEREVDGPDNEFQDKGDEVDVEVNGPTLDKGDEVDVEVDEVDCVHSEEIFRSLDDSDSERECNGGQNVFQERNLKKDGFKFVLGMIFKSASEFKWAVTYHEAMRRKDIKFVKNEGRRVRVCCRHSDVCKWTIFGSRSNPRCPFQIKTYNSEHTCGNQDENRTINSGFLAKLYKDEFRLNMEWGRRQFQEHVKQKLHCQVEGHSEGQAEVEGQSDVEGQAEVEGQSDVEGQAEVEGQSDVEGQAEVEGQSDVEGQADVQGLFEDVQVETQVPEFVLDELGSQEILGSSQSQTVHNQVPQQSSFIASHTTSSSANDSDMLRIGQRIITTAVLQRLARPTKLILIKKKQ